MAQSTHKRSRNWCFTDFKNIDFKTIYANNTDVIRYICVGKEICPKTQKEHNQGWVQFSTPRRMNGVKRIFNSKSLHLEPCYGTEFDNDKYCTKDGKYWQEGKFATQGHRTDIENIKHKLDNGDSLMDIANDNFDLFLRYRQGFRNYKQMVDKKKRSTFRKVKVKVISGPTGCGKTRKAMKDPYNTYKIEGSNLEWWDGYDGENILVIDEYNNDINITKLLNILDGYQLRLPIKGGFTYANWHKVIITTNLKRHEIHPNAKPEHINALNRRISKWKNLYDPFSSGTK